MHEDRLFVGPRSAPDTYRLLQLLGAGAEGEVWSAERSLSQQGRQRVAIKILEPGQGRDVESWERHSALLRSVHHPGLVRVLELFVGPGRHRAGEPALDERHYVVMEHVEGQPLPDWLVRVRDRPLPYRLRTLAGVAAALDELHSGRQTVQAVAHGDVKPGNIVVRPDGSTVLVDPGLMRIADGTLITGRSAPYAAPELFQPGGTIDPATDRFAFAATVAHAVLGEQPPARADGYGLDLNRLTERLRADPMCGSLTTVQRRILDALAAAPAGRPPHLSAWLATLVNEADPTVVLPGGDPRHAPPTVVDALPPWTPPATPGEPRSRSTALVVAVVLLSLAMLAVLLGAAVFGGLRLLEPAQADGDQHETTARPTAAAASAPAASPSPLPSPAGSTAADGLTRARDLLSGTWKGTYRCRQGLTGLTLTVYVDDDQTVKATFEFYPHPGNPDVPRGSFAMEGSYSATTLALRPDYWISQPGDWVMVALGASLPPSGKRIRGEIATAGCSDFEVVKISDDTRLPPV
ncbi:serine/threonine-protein kinase [Catellatospora sp. KI3]|uniref:serine/threonine-protein kinase n=1 Tax=Catellatospora sp. KI3 TaxID=3041620 RepID=UPI0024824582|nr:serine/threonine-protein kinase [Catellatospora sp. KI3]MDI1463221.1 serine/threonine-protein kinase [Catellatospora sp. KI3]